MEIEKKIILARQLNMSKIIKVGWDFLGLHLTWRIWFVANRDLKIWHIIIEGEIKIIFIGTETWVVFKVIFFNVILMERRKIQNKTFFAQWNVDNQAEKVFLLFISNSSRINFFISSITIIHKVLNNLKREYLREQNTHNF